MGGHLILGLINKMYVCVYTGGLTTGHMVLLLETQRY